MLFACCLLLSAATTFFEISVYRNTQVTSDEKQSFFEEHPLSISTILNDLLRSGCVCGHLYLSIVSIRRSKDCKNILSATLSFTCYK
jgi:hypothetical protein